MVWEGRGRARSCVWRVVSRGWRLVDRLVCHVDGMGWCKGRDVPRSLKRGELVRIGRMEGRSGRWRRVVQNMVGLDLSIE